MKGPWLLTVLIILGSASDSWAAKRRAQRQRREVLPLSGPTDEQVWDSGLVDKALSYGALVEKGRQYYEDTSVKRFKGFVLGYVTPWNAGGYDIAVKFRRKLSAVAPVWFQIKVEDGEVVIQGDHDIDTKWIERLREGGGPLVTPRYILELSPQHHVALLRQPRQLVQAIEAHLLKHGFDGLVLEAWSTWHQLNGMQNEQFRADMYDFLTTLSLAIKGGENRRLILAVPPLLPANERAPWIAREDMIELSGHVDGWSVMTYDFSASSGRPGPNAPLAWLQRNVALLEKGAARDAAPLPERLRPSTLLGLNFYGWDYAPAKGGVAAVTAGDLLPLLQRTQPELAWSEANEEHSFEYTDKEGQPHTVWYPTPRSLQLRLQEAERAGLGLSIWELGQGLERFMDLL